MTCPRCHENTLRINVEDHPAFGTLYWGYCRKCAYVTLYFDTREDVLTYIKDYRRILE